MSSLITKNYRGLCVEFTGDGWFNSTPIASRFGKEPSQWLRLPDSKRYIKALERTYGKNAYVKTSKARVDRGGGTWMHPKLGVVFARWLDIDFAVWCDGQVEEIITGRLKWTQARQEGKLARRLETDIIKLFVEYAEKQGSVNAHWFYKNITVGTYRAMFILEKGADWRGLRDHLATLQLNQLATAESIAHKYIMEGMEIGMYYRDIYKYAIAKVEEMARILGKQIPGERVARIGKDA